VAGKVGRSDSIRIKMSSDTLSRQKTPIWFWILGLLLVGYVAACTGQRDNVLSADAWEHLRVLRALTHDLWHPGNPTFASDLPSVRYSPYFVGLAVLCRNTGIDPYNALSAAAVVNMCLLVVAVWLLLAAFEEEGAAGAVLVVMISLWGAAPGYANSYALSDLPWHEVNPSAVGFPLVLLSWALLRRMAMRGWNGMEVAGLILLITMANLEHGMTGAFGMAGLVIVGFFAPLEKRRLSVIIAISVSICAGILCMAWPWYSFLAAVRMHQDSAYWYNPYISKQMFTVWCVPAIVCGVFAIPLRDRPLVRISLAGAAVSLLIGLIGSLIHSAVLARFPLPGMIYLHMSIGIFAQRTEIFKLSSWPERFRSLMAPASEAAYPMLQIVVSFAVLFFLAPQLVDSAVEPHLGRVYLTKILHLRNLQQNVRQTFPDLLSPVGLRDVVLADPVTSWMIPAFRGRVVTAIHYELFVPGQANGAKAVDLFFSPTGTESQREEIIRDYNVRWIALNPSMLSEEMMRSLERQTAVVRETSGMVLMSAPAWIAAGPKALVNVQTP